MRQFTGLPYFPCSDQFSTYPLDRFFPPVPEGLITGWLKQRLISGGQLIDPIGASPHLILETARAGYSILVASNNPIISFMLNILSRAPRKSDFQLALAELSFHKRGDQRLDNHLRSLYLTECPACKAKIDVEYFLWKKDASQPFAKRINCLVCGMQGEYPLSESDQAILDNIGKTPLHYARAIQKVKPESPQAQAAVESAVRLYHPRPLYFLFTLLNAIESMSLPANQRDLLLALILSVCDYANNLWTHPARNQPKILSVPPQFKETNLWLALENSIDLWTGNPSSVSIENHAPVQNSDGLITSLSTNQNGGKIILFNGRMKFLDSQITAIPATAAVSVFPHPNQAFWTLCALWSAWLWGSETAAPLKWAFERQRFDWGWYASALHSPLKILNKIMPPKSPFLVWMPRYSPGLFTTSLTATHSAGYILDSAAIQFEDSTAQLIFSARDAQFVPLHQSFENVVQDQIEELFNKTHEPLPYTRIHAAVLTALDSKMILPEQFPKHPSEAVSELQKQIQKCITTPGFLKCYSQNKEGIDDSVWFANIPSQPDNIISISDQIEIECVRFLRNHPNSSFKQISQAIYELFPGFYTPSLSLIETIVNSYARENRASRTDAQPVQTNWQLNPVEDISLRQNDIHLIETNITEIGNKLGFFTEFEPVLRWLDARGATIYYFHVIATALLTPLLHKPDNPSTGVGVIVFPASRSRLVALKLQDNPHLRQNLEQNWKLIKFRLIRQIASRSSLSLSNWQQMIDQDPPLWEEARQLPIFT